MKTLSPFRRRGMIAILFLSFGFLIFSYLVITGQVASKTTFVGKEGLDTSLGGQNYQRVLFYYHLAGTYALDDALLQHAAAGGQRLGDECKVAGYTLWASEHCTFHVEDVDDSFLKFFDEAFHQHLSRVSPLLGVDVTFPPSYHSSLDSHALHLISDKPLIFSALNKTYSFPLAVNVLSPFESYFSSYRQSVAKLEAQRECMIHQREGSGNYSSCFAYPLWNVTQEGNSLLFDVPPGQEFSPNIGIRFAISLNSLEELHFLDTEYFHV